ncbi:MAG: hypothetical protein N2484_01530 [Clostridia bacterium]|nr:hypothetical protein [Clostridia bacterium]
MNASCLSEKMQRYVIVEVDRIERAEDVLNRMKVEYKTEEDQIFIFCRKELNGLILRNIVFDGINVYNFSSVS